MKKTLNIIEFELKYENDLPFLVDTSKYFCEKMGINLHSQTKVTTSISEFCRMLLANGEEVNINLNLEIQDSLKYLSCSTIIENGKSTYNNKTKNDIAILADEFIHSTNHGNQKLNLRVRLPKYIKNIQENTIQTWKEEYLKKVSSSPFQRLKHDNKELTDAYNIIKEKENKLQEVNNKLEYALEKIEEKNEELQNFAHTVSHDLKSPLNAVLMSSEMMTSLYGEKLDEEMREIMEVNINSANKMKELINRYLAYATASIYEDKYEDINVNEMLKEIHGYVVKPKEVKLTYNDLPNIYYDRHSLHQVLQNIITNAIKYNDKQVIHVTVEYIDKKDTGIFCITDNGPGIEEKHYKSIFDPYKTLDTKSNTDAGTGLGLPMVKKIIERNNGQIWVKSKLGEFTSFYFSIPN